MLNRRGQGALEYLLILAAVIAIAVVVILVAHRVSTPAQQSTLVNQDKFSCAQAGIELVNYNSLPNSAGDVVVRYQGKEYNCISAEGNYLDIQSGDKVFSSCRIHFSDGVEKQLSIARVHKCGPTVGVGCGTSDNVEQDCFIGNFSTLGGGPLPPQGLT